MASAPFVHQYAQLHAVSSTGRSLLAEGPLIVTGTKDKSEPLLLRIGDPETKEVTWSLKPDVPTLKAGPFTFMFAVPDSADFYSIELIPGTPKEVIAQLEAVLQEHTAYAVSKDTEEAHKIQDEQEVVAPSGKKFKTSKGLATGIHKAGAVLAAGITQVGVMVSNGIIYAGKWWRNNSKQNQQPTQMSPATMNTINAVKTTTSVTAKVATKAADTVAGMVGMVANSFKSKKEHDKPHGVVSTTVVTVIEVLDAMHDAGRSVLTTGVEETATCVEYKYGDQAAGATRTGMGVATDLYDVYGAYRAMHTKAIAKAVVKEAFKPYKDPEAQGQALPAKPQPQPIQGPSSSSSGAPVVQGYPMPSAGNLPPPGPTNDVLVQESTLYPAVTAPRPANPPSAPPSK